MKISWQFITASIMACVFSSCRSQTPDTQFVREKIPIEIQGGKPVTIKISSLSGNGWNEVGIRCSPEVWNALNNGTQSITVRLLSSSKNGTRIEQGSPGRPKLWPIESSHYLFTIDGAYRATAAIEIMFPNAPPGITRAEIVVSKTPSDTGL